MVGGGFEEGGYENWVDDGWGENRGWVVVIVVMLVIAKSGVASMVLVILCSALLCPLSPCL